MEHPATACYYGLSKCRCYCKTPTAKEIRKKCIDKGLISIVLRSRTVFCHSLSEWVLCHVEGSLTAQPFPVLPVESVATSALFVLLSCRSRSFFQQLGPWIRRPLYLHDLVHSLDCIPLESSNGILAISHG